MESDMSKLLAPIDKITEQLGVDRIFGAPVTEGDATVIPVASMTFGLGYGLGEGTGPSPEATQEGEGASEGAAGGHGVGGGGGARMRPRGYIHITPDGVSYKPIVDEQRIALAGILLGGWIVFWVARAVRAFAGK